MDWILFGISILAGIWFVHRYKFIDDIETNITDKNNENSIQINEQNNATLNNKDNKQNIFTTDFNNKLQK